MKSATGNGCNNSHGAAASKCSNIATLSDDDFTYGGTTYTFYTILDAPSHKTTKMTVSFSGLTGAAVKTALTGLTLNAGSTALAIADATVDSSELVWPVIGWSVGDTVQLSLTTPTTTTTTPPPPPATRTPPRQEVNEPPNQAPEVAERIEDAALRAGEELEIDLSEAFDDPDGDRLKHSAESSDGSVAAVAVDGDTLTVLGVGGGIAEITVTAADLDRDTASQTFEVAVTAPETVWYLPPASDPARRGFVRVLNHSDASGRATVTATDDAGRTYEPLTLALEARQAAHFDVADMESGNAAKGLTGATGPGTGGWRLEIDSETLEVEALAYVRAADGFVAGMNAVASGRDGALRIPVFNPGSEVDQVSLLRLVNPTDREAEATVTGVDDAGRRGRTAVHLTLPAGRACTVDAAQLESGSGLACGPSQRGLGDGEGRWRLAVDSDAPLVALNLLESPAGHLANLSESAAPDRDGTYHVHLFPAAGDAHGRQGFVRVVNRMRRRGTVTIAAFDDTDTEREALSLDLRWGAAVHLDADDLELGNPEKGLSGSTGAGTGAWRLALSSASIDFEAHSYVRTPDGFLTAMQATAPVADRRIHRVAFFNPADDEAAGTSVLRLVNPGTRGTKVAITGTDDAGARHGATVRVLVPAGDAVELDAAQLESGEVEPARVVSYLPRGALGDGSGRWRLRVESSRWGEPIVVTSLLSSPSGPLSNLSLADDWRGYERTPAALLPPPATVTLEPAGEGRLRGVWSAVPGALHRVDLMRDGRRDGYRSLRPSTRTSFRWSRLRAGTYTIRACSENEDRACGDWSAVSNAVEVVD